MVKVLSVVAGYTLFVFHSYTYKHKCTQYTYENWTKRMKTVDRII